MALISDRLAIVRGLEAVIEELLQLAIPRTTDKWHVLICMWERPPQVGVGLAPSSWPSTGAPMELYMIPLRSFLEMSINDLSAQLKQCLSDASTPA